MSFRQFGGLQYAARHNAVSSNYNTANNLLVTQNVGQTGSYINFESDVSGNLSLYGDLDVSGNLTISSGNSIGTISAGTVSTGLNVLGQISLYTNNIDASGTLLIGNPYTSTTTSFPMTGIIIGSENPYSENLYAPSGTGLSSINILTKRGGTLQLGSSGINSGGNIHISAGQYTITIGGGGGTGYAGIINIGANSNSGSNYYNTVNLCTGTSSNILNIGSSTSTINLLGTLTISNKYNLAVNSLINAASTLTYPTSEIYSIDVASDITITLPTIAAANNGTKIIFRRTGGTTDIYFVGNGSQNVYNSSNSGGTGEQKLMPIGFYSVTLYAALESSSTSSTSSYAWFQI